MTTIFIVKKLAHLLQIWDQLLLPSNRYMAKCQ